MTSKWEQHGLTEKTIEILGDVPSVASTPHALGRAYLTAYQIAIKLHERHRDLVERELRWEIGGAGIGVNFSLSSYVGAQLSRLVRAGHAEIEGAFLSNQSVTALTFADTDGNTITSSATGTGFDLSLFRLRGPSSR